MLSKLSKRNNCIVIAPTFGLGNWDKPGGAEFVVEVVREVIAAHPLDSENVFLMGYSNGAVGVTRAATREPELFKGLIYLSPIMEDEFSAGQLELAIRHCRFLFLHGGLDRRIPRSFVEGTVTSLERLECDVRLKIYDEEDHYLLFSPQEAVLREISEFMMD